MENLSFFRVFLKIFKIQFDRTELDLRPPFALKSIGSNVHFDSQL